MAEPKYKDCVVTLPVRKGQGGAIFAAGADIPVSYTHLTLPTN